jgi:hypothetical protein
MSTLIQRLTVLATLLGMLLVAPTAASAQDDDGTIPGAADCTVEPRTEEEILAIVEAAPSPRSDEYDKDRARREKEWKGVTVVGPVDFATQQAIRDTVYQLIGCVNGKMPLSQYALFTEDAIVNNSPTVEELRGENTDLEIVDGEVVEQAPGTVLDVLYVQSLSNGQVQAVVIFTGESSGLPFDALAMLFEQVDGRWLFDTP